MSRHCWIAVVICFASADASGNTQRCSISSDKSGKVLSVSDGTNERCIAVVVPSSVTEPSPVLFWFHGGEGNAGTCGGDHFTAELGQLAADNGFALVCAEALQYESSSSQKSGLWQIPRVMTNATGTPCEESDSIEIGYIKSAVAALEKGSAGLPKMDTTRIFTLGCSLGSAFSEYTANCLKARTPTALSAFATHSSGWKTKDDGTDMGPEFPDGRYEWGECPDCQYWPFVPTKFTDSLGMKACVFDNTGDGDFYKTSKALAQKWTNLGMRAETHFESGGHCEIHSFAEIVNCLDDQTKRLLPNGPAPAPSPSPTPAPSPSSDPPKACQDCLTSHCGGTPKQSDACTRCGTGSEGACTSSCNPYPYDNAVKWFCSQSSNVAARVAVLYS